MTIYSRFKNHSRSTAAQDTGLSINAVRSTYIPVAPSYVGIIFREQITIDVNIPGRKHGRFCTFGGLSYRDTARAQTSPSPVQTRPAGRMTEEARKGASRREETSRHATEERTIAITVENGRRSRLSSIPQPARSAR